MDLLNVAVYEPCLIVLEAQWRETLSVLQTFLRKPAQLGRLWCLQESDKIKGTKLLDPKSHWRHTSDDINCVSGCMTFCFKNFTQTSSLHLFQ